jgi:hypothetical protein
MLLLNIAALPPPTLSWYHRYLCSIRHDPMSREQHKLYLEHRAAVATLIAFPTAAL